MLAEEHRTRLIGEIAKVLREECVPDDARAAGLVLIGWLARRMPGECAHALGVEEMRAACAAAHAPSGDPFRQSSAIPFRETSDNRFGGTSGNRFRDSSDNAFRDSSDSAFRDSSDNAFRDAPESGFRETSDNRFGGTSGGHFRETPAARFRANGREPARRPGNRSR